MVFTIFELPIVHSVCISIVSNFPWDDCKQNFGGQISHSPHKHFGASDGYSGTDEGDKVRHVIQAR